MAGLAAVVMYTVLSENYRCALLFNLTFYMQLIFVLDVVTPYFGLINRFLLALSNLSIVLIYEAQIHVCCFPECMHISGKMTRVICIARRHLWIREERWKRSKAAARVDSFLFSAVITSPVLRSFFVFYAFVIRREDVSERAGNGIDARTFNSTPKPSFTCRDAACHWLSCSDRA